MMRILIKFVFILLCVCSYLYPAVQTEWDVRSFKGGSTGAYLKQIPLDTIIRLYATHEEAQKDPSLVQYASFFDRHRSLFDRVMHMETANAPNYYILYHGVNGQRLIFDTLRVLYDRTHQTKLPREFMLLRDPRDPDVRTDDLRATLAARWPAIPVKHQKVILEALLGRKITLQQVPLLWKLISADMDWNEDEDFDDDEDAFEEGEDEDEENER